MNTVPTTVLTQTGATACVAGESSVSQLWLDQKDMQSATGWVLKPEGLCKDEICVPIPPGRETDFLRGDQVNVAAFWKHQNQPAVATEAGDVWYLGEGAAQRNSSLQSLTAPDFSLPDFSGKLHSLHDFRRQRVLLITWASW